MRDGNIHGSPTHRRIMQERKEARGLLSGYVDDDISHSDALAPLLAPTSGQQLSIESIEYKIAYKKAQKQHEEARRRLSANGKMKMSVMTMPSAFSMKERRKHRHRLSAEKRTRRDVESPPIDAPLNKDGQTPGALLVQLQDAGTLNLKWEIKPSTKFNDGEHETVRLILGTSSANRKNAVSLVNTRRVYEHERNIHYISKKAVKQHLCAAALTDLCNGNYWEGTTFKEMKEYMQRIAAASKAKPM